MKEVFISPEEQKLIEETNRPGSAKVFLAAARRHPKSVILTYYRAMHAATGDATNKNPALAKRWLQRVFPRIREAALRGDAAAQNCMGCLYNEKSVAGFVVPYDCAEALRWFRKSARQGFVKAQINIACAYQHGLGVKMNYARAAMWHRRAAEQGAYYSAATLGVLYEKGGHGLRKDDEASFRWTQRAAMKGYSEAEWYLGTRYETGRGVERSAEQAFAWYCKSAEHGSATGMFLLGHCYIKGSGVGQDRARAWQLNMKAAALGSPYAQRMAGLAYWYGYGGLAVDMEHAEHWLRKSAKGGCKLAREDLKKLRAARRNRTGV